jgi:adenylylsulfate kinase-like enzyme
MIYWLTGQPGAGKTTLAQLMVTSYPNDGIIVDGDNIRDIFDNKDYSEQGRRKNIELAQNISHFLHMKGHTVIVSLVSPYRDQRESFKEKLGDGIVELYVHTTEIRGREERHVHNYEPPLENFVDVDTTDVNPIESIKQITKILNHE